MPRQRDTPGDPALDRLAAAPSAAPTLLLHSGRFDPRWARRSLAGRPTLWFRHEIGGRSTLLDAHSAEPHPLADDLTGRPWRDLRHLLHHPDLPGRWIGYLSYDLGRVIEPGKLAPRHPGHGGGGAGDWPLIELGYCGEVEELPVADPPDLSPLETVEPRGGPVRSVFSRPDYEAAVRRVLDYIAAGDVFQVNLAQRLTSRWTGTPRDLFRRLAAVSPAWYGAYLECGSGGAALPAPDRALLSTSPELFLEVRDRAVVTRPIKGTRPVDPALRHTGVAPVDDPNYRALLHAEKDAAELAMIVDLMRNDLGRVCSYGTVKVLEPRTIEAHPTIYHAVATVAGELHQTKDIVDLLRATLPGGSITGAPKVRAMQIIDELEPAPRGPYCGCIGWLARDAAQLNIAIRTMCLTREPAGDYRVDFAVGGGIVADSQPDAEYDETLDKARAMLRALGVEPPEG